MGRAAGPSGGSPLTGSSRQQEKETIHTSRRGNIMGRAAGPSGGSPLTGSSRQQEKETIHTSRRGNEMDGEGPH